MGTLDREELTELARQIRRDTLRMVHGAGSGHPGGALSAAEIFAVLYGAVMRHSKRAGPGNDRLILSNGHICAAWYAVLSLYGYLDREILATHRRLDSVLQGHPSRRKWKEIVETSTGPLGQGISVANGIALSNRLMGDTNRVFCVVGDGELQEGQVWEAVMSAAHLRLTAMRMIVLWNGIQIDGHIRDVKDISPIPEKFQAFGWNVITVDGHDISALLDAFLRADQEKERPTAVVASVVMAKGVAFMEDDPKWHGACPTDEQLRIALEEIGVSKKYTDYPKESAEMTR